MIVTTTWERKTFRIQAILVTVENIEELAEWCGGELSTKAGAKYIIVPSWRQKTSRAYVGDWITRLTDANNFRVYKTKTFLEAFREIHNEAQRYAEIHQVIVNAMRQQDAATYNGESSKGMDLVADKATRAILGLF